MQLTVTEHWLHPEGIFPAQLVTFEETQGAFGPGIKWVLETNVEREDGKSPQLALRTSQKIGAKSNLGKLLTAFGVPLPETTEDAQALDLDALIGKRIKIEVRHSLGADGTTWANIESFGPIRGGTMEHATRGTEGATPTPGAPNGNGAKAAPATKPAGKTKDPFEDPEEAVVA